MVSATERSEAKRLSEAGFTGAIGTGDGLSPSARRIHEVDRFGGEMASATPERSLTQRMDALARANEIRSARAQLKRDLKARRVSMHALLLDPPEYLQTAKVFDILLAVPKYGRVKVNKMLLNCRISPSKTIGGLSERQRTELVALLRRP